MTKYVFMPAEQAKFRPPAAQPHVMRQPYSTSRGSYVTFEALRPTNFTRCAPKMETCGFAWRIPGRGPTRQKIADKAQRGRLFCALPRDEPQASLCLQRRSGHIWPVAKRQVKSTLSAMPKRYVRSHPCERIVLCFAALLGVRAVRCRFYPVRSYILNSRLSRK
jgi:hypothetical protein